MTPLPVTYTFKLHQNAKAAEYIELSRAALLQTVRNLDDTAWRNGIVGVWLRAIVQIDTIDCNWIHLDFEFPRHSGTLAQTIEAAQDFYAYLADIDLADDVRIILSGNGIRFLWPWIIPAEYSEAFWLWLKSLRNVDVSPFTNRAPYRFMAYRGHWRQGKPQDKHVKILPPDINFYDLDEHEYTRLVAGKPDIAEYRRLFPELLPTSFAPQPWIDMLQPWQRKVELKRLVYTPGFPRRQFGVDWEAIDEALETMGITKTREFTVADKAYTRLSACPCCKRSSTKPYLNANGRVYCFGGSCAASRSKGGAAPWQWIKGYEVPELEDDSDESAETTSTLEEIRQRIADAVTASWTADLLVTADPGSGKTTTVLKTLLAGVEIRA